MQSTSSRLARNHARRIPGRTVSSTRTAPPSSFVATVVGTDANARVLVLLPGTEKPQPARLLAGIDRELLLPQDEARLEVLVVLDGGRIDRPVIIGVVEPGSCSVTPQLKSTQLEIAASSRKERVLVEALAELVLKCGAGSITLRKDGKIIVRGTHLLSRSSGPIRIKGGHVEIN